VVVAYGQPSHCSTRAFGQCNPASHVVDVHGMHEVLRLEPVPLKQTKICVHIHECVYGGGHAREVALQDEHGGRVLKTRNLPRLVDVSNDQLVRLSDVCEHTVDGVAILGVYMKGMITGTPFVRRASAPVHYRHTHTQTWHVSNRVCARCCSELRCGKETKTIC